MQVVENFYGSILHGVSQGWFERQWMWLWMQIWMRKWKQTWTKNVIHERELTW